MPKENESDESGETSTNDFFLFIFTSKKIGEMIPNLIYTHIFFKMDGQRPPTSRMYYFSIGHWLLLLLAVVIRWR